MIFVNCSGSAIALTPETETCDAILQAWYAGESGGQAVADVLFGDYNPGANFPITFYKSSEQLKRLWRLFDERTYISIYEWCFVSFRLRIELYQICYCNATHSQSTIKANEAVKITIPVSNTGKRRTEIVQVYVRKVKRCGRSVENAQRFSNVSLLKAGGES